MAATPWRPVLHRDLRADFLQGPYTPFLNGRPRAYGITSPDPLLKLFACQRLLSV